MSGIQDRITEQLTRERVALEVRRGRRPFIQLMALLAMALVAFALLLRELHQPAPWSGQYSVGIAVANADAAAVGDPVRLAGVQVGKVTAVRLTGGVPVLTANIDPRYAPLRRDAVVELRPNTPLQDMYLDIVSRGTRAAGTIRGGGELTAAQTVSPVQMGQVINLFDSGVRPRVVASINALGEGLGDHGNGLREALIELSPFLRSARDLNLQLAVRRHETESLIHNFALLSTEVARRGAQLHGLVESGSTALGALSAEAAPLGRLLTEMPPMLSELPRSFGALRGAAGQLGPAARALLPTADALGPALAALERLSPTANTALAALQSTMTPVRALLSSATPLAGRLASAFGRLRHSVPQLYADTTQLLPCKVAVEKFFQWTLSVSKLSTIRGDMQRGVGLVSPQSLSDIAGSASPTPSYLQTAPTCTGSVK